MQVGCLVRRCKFLYAWQYAFIDTSYKVTAVSEDTKRIKLYPHDSWVVANQFEVIEDSV